MSSNENLKAELANADAKIGGIEDELGKAKKVRGSILDRLFELETGFLIGSDALYSARHRVKKNIRVKILRRFDRWGRDWSCEVRLYKKDGTLGQSETRVFRVKEELTQLED